MRDTKPRILRFTCAAATVVALVGAVGCGGTGSSGDGSPDGDAKDGGGADAGGRGGGAGVTGAAGRGGAAGGSSGAAGRGGGPAGTGGPGGATGTGGATGAAGTTGAAGAAAGGTTGTGGTTGMGGTTGAAGASGGVAGNPDGGVDAVDDGPPDVDTGGDGSPCGADASGNGDACDTGQSGVCAVGSRQCVNGALACVPLLPPGSETCDSLDNDCDGVVDNGNPGGGSACNTGTPGACAAGTTACSNGDIGCYQDLVPTAEICDGLDNDCDGTVDNGSPGGGSACSSGKFGVCAAGTTACSNGAVVCNQNLQPTTEICDGLDNDCDGIVDNGNPGGSASCNTGKFGVCAAGTTACSNGTIVCNQNLPPSAEICDGTDNDCNGVTDNGNPGGGSSCNTGKLGICAIGTTACSNGTIVCNQTFQPSPEICDGLDNDCNGVTDNGACN